MIIPSNRQPHNVLAKHQYARLDALSGQRFIGFEPDLPTTKAIERQLKDHSIKVRNVINFDNIESV